MESQVLFLLVSCLIMANAIGGESAHSCISKIYAFGDSLTDTGNTKSGVGPANFQGVSHLPYGQTYFHRPTNRYSDGRLVIDFIAQAMSLSLLQPYMKKNADFGHGVNFAVAGSTALDHDFFTQRNITLDQTPQSLGTQVLWYNGFIEKTCQNYDAVGKEACKHNSSAEALYWVGEIGANDYTYILGSDIQSHTLRMPIIEKKLQALEGLIQQGARYIVVQGMPLTGCLTMAMVLGANEGQDQFGCITSVNQEAQQHNDLLQQRLKGLQQKYPSTSIVYADYYGAHSKVLQNPKLYGFENSKTACCGAGGGTYNFDIFATCGEESVSPISGQKATSCGNPAKYMIWDGIHFTEAMNSVIANMFLEGGFTHPAFNSFLAKKCQ